MTEGKSKLQLHDTVIKTGIKRTDQATQCQCRKKFNR